MNKTLILLLVLLASCSTLPPSRSMEESKARLDSAVLYGCMVKEDAQWQMRIEQSKHLPEKSTKPLDHSAIDRFTQKQAAKLGPVALLNKRYNQGQITKEQWFQATLAHEQSKAMEAEERARRSDAIAQGFIAASASINQSVAAQTAAQNQAMYSRPAFQPMPMTVYPIEAPQMSRTYHVRDSQGGSSTVTVH